ncbi:MAG: glycosyltransferase [Oscillospiraceae bacterium]|nr:glycosyltransferase [Oscillospiraceae bacterium]MBQ2861834.1 glycosyltransferase [Oscillospiraceae bacterium]
MRVLILSCNTGGGHNSCAAAIAEAFAENGIYTRTEDSLAFVSHGFANFMSKGHSLMYRRFPAVFKFGYGFAEKHSSFLAKGSLVYKLLTSGAEKLYSYITENEFDTIICVHVFCGMILEKAFEGKSKNGIKTAFVATDYTCSPGAASFDYDYCFIPDNSLAGEFIANGVPEEKIIPSGIPVRKNFICRIEKEKAKAAFCLCGKRHLLIMGGSMGCGPVEKILEYLHKDITADTDISVVCGNNRKLYKKLYSKYKTAKNIHIMGFATDVPLLMDSADLYLTKPGGLCTSEALAKALPMVMIDAVAGCEKHNMEYFIKICGGESAPTPKTLAKKCSLLLSDEEKLELLRNNLMQNQKNNAAAEISDYLGGAICKSFLRKEITENSDFAD